MGGADGVGKEGVGAGNGHFKTMSIAKQLHCEDKSL